MAKSLKMNIFTLTNLEFVFCAANLSLASVDLPKFTFTFFFDYLGFIDKTVWYGRDN